MGDAARMRAGQRRRQLARRPDDVVRRRPRAAGDFVAQRLAVDEFGCDVQLVADLFERVDGADAGMRQRRRRARLAAQPIAMRGDRA